MNILLIDNNTQHFKDLNASLLGHNVEVQKYYPGLEFHTQGKDLVILSGGGGEGLEIHDKHESGQLWYEDEMRFVLSTDKPVIGICMGFEVICHAYGAKIDKIGRLIKGFTPIKSTLSGHKLFNRVRIEQFEAHEWQVSSISSKHFEVLAESETGVEVIRHRQKPIFATQFHPEKGGTLGLKRLIASQICY
jgi:anthranilate/para-aminobenzoate synthase component II